MKLFQKRHRPKQLRHRAGRNLGTFYFWEGSMEWMKLLLQEGVHLMASVGWVTRASKCLGNGHSWSIWLKRKYRGNHGENSKLRGSNLAPKGMNHSFGLIHWIFFFDFLFSSILLLILILGFRWSWSNTSSSVPLFGSVWWLGFHIDDKVLELTHEWPRIGFKGCFQRVLKWRL